MNIENMNWFWPLFLLFLAGFALAFYTLGRDRRNLETLGYHNLILAPLAVWVRRVVKGCLLLLGLFLCLLGAGRLQGKLIPEDLNLRGVDVMIVLDVSKSMLTQDMVPNRLEAAKKALINWIQGRNGDRIGLVIFAGQALVQVPLTLDLEAVSLVLSKADPDAVDRGGTDIGEAIRTALTAFDKDDMKKRGKAILLITDGEITEGSAILPEACKEANERNVPVVAVGIGTPQGRPIPDGASFWGEAIFKRDRDGNIHISHLDEENLRKIASITGGTYIQGESERSLSSIGDRLDRLEKTMMKDKGAMRREELSPALGAFTAATLILSSIL